jgi:hypothetical protein
MRFGEGKWGGAEQVVITTKDGKKRVVVSSAKCLRRMDAIAWAIS